MTGIKYDGTRQLHDLLVKMLLRWYRRANIPHMGGVGGFNRTCKGLFTKFVNNLPELDPNSPTHTAALRFRQGIIPDLMIDTRSMDRSENAT